MVYEGHILITAWTTKRKTSLVSWSNEFIFNSSFLKPMSIFGPRLSGMIFSFSWRFFFWSFFLIDKRIMTPFVLLCSFSILPSIAQNLLSFSQNLSCSSLHKFLKVSSWNFPSTHLLSWRHFPGSSVFLFLVFHLYFAAAYP